MIENDTDAKGAGSNIAGSARTQSASGAKAGS